MLTHSTSISRTIFDTDHVDGNIKDMVRTLFVMIAGLETLTRVKGTVDFTKVLQSTLVIILCVIFNLVNLVQVASTR